MSGVVIPADRPVRSAPYELHSGDALTQAEFHQRYLRDDRELPIELVEGIVYMASPVGRQHARYRVNLGHLLGHYEAFTKGVAATADGTVILDSRNEVRPDGALIVLPEFGGQTTLASGEYTKGPPEWVAEIAHSSISIDLHRKKAAYQRAGVHEYFVLSVADQTVHWFNFRARRPIVADESGVMRSRVFPGLWIDVPALLNHKARPMIQALNAGLASPEHKDFVDRLAVARKKTR
ncbi:MAG: Uma2 family endonuclease [Planctomycetota bacterium]|nr:Uma2 family endonuclease [Planctomycetota bacterium]